MFNLAIGFLLHLSKCFVITFTSSIMSVVPHVKLFILKVVNIPLMEEILLTTVYGEISPMMCRVFFTSWVVSRI